MMRLAIHSKRTITPEGTRDAYVLIKDGVIDEVTEQLPGEWNDEVIEAGDKVLMAGVIDPHVHINEPGRTAWEGFNTATKAAIAGGITTLVDMPLNASPVTTTVNAFEQKLNAASEQLHCNVGFWGGVVPGNDKEILPLINRGVLGFKAFLTHSGIEEFPNVTEDDLRKAMPIIAGSDLPLLVHCELTDGSRYTNTTPRSYKDYLASRPKKWEDDAIALMIRLCEEFNCRTHIVHLSSANSIDQIAKAKQEGLPLTVETAQHYLYFNSEDITDGAPAYKCAPPIRERQNNEKLWQALKDGIIDFVATDHSPAPPELKQLDSGNLAEAWGGIASLQFALPVLWTAAKKHGYSLENIAKWLCERPGKFIHQKKGKIQKGYDADLVIWDENKTFTVTEEGIYHKHKITPYLSETLYGVVSQTFVAGKTVFHNGIFTQLNTGMPLIRNDLQLTSQTGE